MACFHDGTESAEGHAPGSVTIPPGAGYVPRNNMRVDAHEVAALQERARGDHQSVLQALAAAIRERGGRTWYNNNIDLLGEVAGDRVLIEAKSLNSAADAVDRMRYGIGQLFDYRYRYRDEIGDAQPVLAFGSPPAKGDEWISSVLQANGIAFLSRSGEKIVPMNLLAERLAIFD